MQNGYVVSDVLQSCSWERWRLRVSINHIVIQLPYILKRKTNGLSGIFCFLSLRMYLYSLSYYQLKRNCFKDSYVFHNSILIHFSHRMIAKYLVLKRDNYHVSFGLLCSGNRNYNETQI